MDFFFLELKINSLVYFFTHVHWQEEQGTEALIELLTFTQRPNLYQAK